MAGVNAEDLRAAAFRPCHPPAGPAPGVENTLPLNRAQTPRKHPHLEREQRIGLAVVLLRPEALAPPSRSPTLQALPSGFAQRHQLLRPLQFHGTP